MCQVFSCQLSTRTVKTLGDPEQVRQGVYVQFQVCVKIKVGNDMTCMALWAYAGGRGIGFFLLQMHFNGRCQEVMEVTQHYPFRCFFFFTMLFTITSDFKWQIICKCKCKCLYDKCGEILTWAFSKDFKVTTYMQTLKPLDSGSHKSITLCMY